MAVTLITGGCRSGKSRMAQRLASAYEQRVFIATAQPIDHEMERRIAAHQRERGDGWTTLEEPLDLAAALQRVPHGTQVAVVDCITVWLGNLMYLLPDDETIHEQIGRFINALSNVDYSLLIVTNEVGMGIVPADRETRRYRDLAGFTNQRLADAADQVIFMVSGLPINLKGETR